MSTAVSVEAPDDVDADLELDTVPAYSLLARVGAEVFGTFLLVLLGVGTALWASVSSVAGAGLAVPLAFGIAVLGGASAVGHVSGGHFNPAVTLGAAIARRISWGDLVPYWVAQLIGGILASAALLFLMPAGLGDATGGTNRTWFSGTSNGFGEHSPLATATQGAVSFSLTQAIIIEVVATAVFIGVILGVTDRRARGVNAPIAIGLTLAALVALTVPFTNGSLNPARSTASALFSDFWAISQLWVFWFAPLVGGALAGLVYVLVTSRGDTKIVELPTETALTEQQPASVVTRGATTEAPTEIEEDDIDALLARRAAQPQAEAGAGAAPGAEPEAESGDDADGTQPSR